MAQGLLHGAQLHCPSPDDPCWMLPEYRVVGLVLYRDAVYSASWRCAGCPHVRVAPLGGATRRGFGPFARQSWA